MKRTISCFCDNSFSVDIPGEIDLDAEPHYLDEILDGSFLNFTCPRCGKKHKPEFPLVLRWPERNLSLEALPETERGEFYRRKKENGPGETVIGYPELAERVAVYRDRLIPEAVEVLKYHILLKAEETWPDEDVSVWYQNGAEGSPLEFHLHGFKSGEIAVSRLPAELYEKTLADYRRNPGGEAFASLRFRSYLSVQNALRPEEGK